MYMLICSYDNSKSRKKKNFVEEMKTSAIIDTGCTETIPREEWFQSYIKNLDDT